MCYPVPLQWAESCSVEKRVCGMIFIRMEVGEEKSLKKLGVVSVILAIPGVCVCDSL